MFDFFKRKRKDGWRGIYCILSFKMMCNKVWIFLISMKYQVCSITTNLKVVSGCKIHSLEANTCNFIFITKLHGNCTKLIVEIILNMHKII